MCRCCMSLSSTLELLGELRWKRCAVVVISRHLVSALSRSRMRRRVSGYFRGASNSSRQLMFASRLLFQQKENRCARMSTADYSCNVARKRAPPQLGSSAPLLHPFRMADSFSPGSEFLFRPTDREKKTPHNRPHPLHTWDAILSKHRGLPPTLYQL